ncbi:MAG: cofactor-independent phosphoglycerate mutase [Deltaproteobacteria bacterium]|nr:cofactor-independent phosphoglycerate mutase [Deltaproteobacteria bacterium]
MKYAILIGDGMGDKPIASLGGKTVLEHAKTPNMDFVAANGETGLYKSVPEGYPPGSDVASMSILGYDPRKYYSGRAPIEAASLGIKLEPTDVAYRCNFVSLDLSAGKFYMRDYSAGHISTEEGARLIEMLDDKFSNRGVRFYAGKSYRHIMVWAGGKDAPKTTPPHDISGQGIRDYLPSGDGSDKLRVLMEGAAPLLRQHPVNEERRLAGKNTADSIWLWGQGKAPSMPTMKSLYGVDGVMISAVDLLNGLGVCAGLEVIKVPGVTGYIDTNYEGKASYALKALETKDFVCVHVEAPDEAGHQGSLKDKITAIEDFDKRIVGPVLEGIKKFGEYRVMVLCDHPTPVEIKTHTREAVPYAAIGAKWKPSNVKGYSEAEAASTGIVRDSAEEFIKWFLK